VRRARQLLCRFLAYDIMVLCKEGIMDLRFEVGPPHASLTPPASRTPGVRAAATARALPATSTAVGRGRRIAQHHCTAGECPCPSPHPPRPPLPPPPPLLQERFKMILTEVEEPRRREAFWLGDRLKKDPNYQFNYLVRPPPCTRLCPRCPALSSPPVQLPGAPAPLHPLVPPVPCPLLTTTSTTWCAHPLSLRSEQVRMPPPPGPPCSMRTSPLASARSSSGR